MSISSIRELPRTFEEEVGSPAVAVRRWVVVLSDDTLTTPTSEITILTDTCGLEWGTTHPIHTALRLRKFTLAEGYEGSPYHVLVEATYSILRPNEYTHPTSRAAEWTVESRAGEVAALSYYDGSTLRPLTNSAYDYFPGLTAPESMIAFKVRQNFAAFPTGWVGSQNYVNSSSWYGLPTHTVKVDGVNVVQTVEQWNSAMVTYWASEATLLYRQSGHNLQLPDIGWNFISGGQKRRAMVFDFENSEWIASPNPVGLDGSGGQTGGAPSILNRRVCPEGNLTSTFGTPS